jgi:hypothetical protein
VAFTLAKEQEQFIARMISSGRYGNLQFGSHPPFPSEITLRATKLSVGSAANSSRRPKAVRVSVTNRQGRRESGSRLCAECSWLGPICVADAT